MRERFDLPDVGPLAAVHLPPIERTVLPNGLRVWSIPRPELPAITLGVVIRHGTGADPAHQPGLSSLVAALVDEGAGGRDSLALADAIARIGGNFEVEVGSDATTLALTSLSRCFDRALGIMADIAMRPLLGDSDFRRVRELRQSRLRQLTQSASASADRLFLKAVFADHPYGHGQYGTIATLDALTVDDARRHWARAFRPDDATLIVVGDATPVEVFRAAERIFGEWTPAKVEPLPEILPPQPVPATDVAIVPRPGATQSELRIGHLGPPRTVDRYHAIVLLNAILGGQFTSRINLNLRERRGITYGAVTTFDMRRMGGTFSSATGVQSNATGTAVSEVLAEIAAVRGSTPVTPAELDRAKNTIARGYVRQFETTTQLGRAAVVLATYDLPDDTFDQFVPRIDAVTIDDVSAVAAEHLMPERAAIVVVGDEATCRPEIEALGRSVVSVTPEF